MHQPDQNSFLFKLTNRLTNHQKYYLMIFLVALAFVLVIWGVVQYTNQQVNLIDRELYSNRYQQVVRTTQENLYRHQLLVSQLKNHNTGATRQMRQLQGSISDALRDPFLLKNAWSTALPEEDLKEVKESFKGVVRKWEFLRRKSFELDTPTSDAMHIELMGDLTKILDQYAKQVDPDLDLNVAGYLLMECSMNTLPREIKSLAELIIGVDPGSEEILRVQIQADTLELKEAIEQILQYLRENPGYQEVLAIIEEGWIGYQKKLEPLIKSPELFLQSNAQHQIEQRQLLKSSFEFLDLIRDQTNVLLLERQTNLIPTKYLFLVLPLVLTFLGVYLGRYFVGRVIDSIRNLDKGFRLLHSGDLRARVPILFNDEIGAASVGFNQMADKIETMVTQQKELFEANKELANGNFEVRMAVDSEAEEQTQSVAKSFNSMAESIQAILQQIQNLGHNLTSSGQTISESSIQQELAITNQESTTKVIMGTANEIATRAKDYSVTVSDVKQVAQQTSALAFEGRHSLIRMEVVMRKMVEASETISEKLAILNDKAEKIHDAIITIIEVADQTNLLSLNGEIVADKSGEYGRSFSVIAGETRSLADQTARATLGIEKIVAEMLLAVRSSVGGVEDFTKEIREAMHQVETVKGQLGEIVEEVQVLAERFEGIDEEMNNQQKGAELIYKALVDLDDKAQITLEFMRQFRFITEQLNESAGSIKKTVSEIQYEERS